MRTPTQLTALLALALVTLVSASCSKREPAASATTPAASAAPATGPQTAIPAVCEMVTAAQMSTVLGTTVNVEKEDGGSSTTCRYKPAESSMPYVELSIDWGGGKAAMVATRMLGRLEPGMTNPFAGLGDDASATGPALWVRTGEDLIRLTLMGVDDDVAVAKRIVSMMRPKMGASARAEQGANVPEGQGARGAKGQGGQGADSPEAKVEQIIEHSLRRLTNRQPPPPAPASRSSAPLEELTLAAAKGPAIRIPLVAGLMVVGAQHEPGRGDYEPMITVTKVADSSVSTIFSADLPEGDRLVLNREILRDDLKTAREYRSWYESGDPATFPGTTSLRLSTAVYTDIKNKGKAELTQVFPDRNPLTALVTQISGAPMPKRTGVLERIESHPLAFLVLLNDEPVEVHVIHARGKFGDAVEDFYVLDDPDNPIVMMASGTARGRVVRIAFPTPDTTPIEEKLKKESRVELHGIYFDFGKATIRPESESVLRDIAAALTRNPEWKISIEGHTDNIGGDPLNLDLSRRRADAVKQALVDRYRLSASTLTTAGFGATRPNASNDTVSGRARNRRVELVRQ